ncbi:antibiotic biosynthesis monooxygenase [Sinorhizobium sp. BG8]|uniref:antibiotic biosynthesis monooxygenase family protein n=1 Tax=Sinorhizobium sp. BG8 TaxID=2613773 RepID=UPI00193CADF1|nr:antibiotic biosynthesis monooxygenase [Sinorhizobium sp. BG8]QRM56229.1 antibiotic biosynthesis monooxygenase [Sinorhizobium sp. BG8]
MSAMIYRIDKFVVPAGAREEFLANVMRTDALLRTQEGFIEHTVLEQVGGPGEFNIVTMARWENADVVERARTAIAAAHRAAGFDPQALFKRLDIRADIATYRDVQAASPNITAAR